MKCPKCGESGFVCVSCGEDMPSLGKWLKEFEALVKKSCERCGSICYENCKIKGFLEKAREVAK